MLRVFQFFSKYKQKFIYKVTEIEVSQLGCVGSGEKLQRQKKGRWSLGERKDRPKGEGEGRGVSREGSITESFPVLK